MVNWYVDCVLSVLSFGWMICSPTSGGSTRIKHQSMLSLLSTRNTAPHVELDAPDFNFRDYNRRTIEVTVS